MKTDLISDELEYQIERIEPTEEINLGKLKYSVLLLTHAIIALKYYTFPIVYLFIYFV